MDFIDDFIEEYKVNPCLWKADSVDFRNRSKRQEAYMKLIEVATKHGEMYNVERTKQKINNLRCAFRHQLRKCNEIKKKGEKFEPYCPKRRYFESLMFLKDEEIPDKKAKRHDNHPPLQQQYSESAVTLIPAENCEELSDAESLTKPHKADNQKLSPKNCPTEYLFEDASAACAPDPIISIQTVNANNNNNNNHGSGATIKEVEIVMTAADSRVISERRKSLPDIPKQIGGDSEQVRPVVAASQLKQNQNQNKINRKRSSSLSSQQSEDNEAVPAAKFRADISTIDFERLFSLALKSADHQLDDHFSSFGKIIAHKLRSMDATQAIYAEKIIADVLYQGQLKMLSTLSTHQFSGVDNATVYVDSHSK